ncbi:hypothetical protein OBBRIDRAFT_770337 [Obba rivulosa]|uniref:Uncharacterized protein n=1 Tax=Obba rivulosa TaxID=1052685 RepID=A0A8E2DQP6_9APHY|nr:hypothetical protein OBBRIDRAFT_770337 [Obba rivulosa]
MSASQDPPRHDHPPPDPALPARYLPLLHCPLCVPSRLLVSPYTLRCGHTVCASHLPAPSATSAVPRCPLPTCTPSTAALPHPQANVAFIPAPPPATVPGPSPRVDVTVSKIISLLLAARAWFAQEQLPPRIPTPSPAPPARRRRILHTPTSSPHASTSCLPEPLHLPISESSTSSVLPPTARSANAPDRPDLPRASERLTKELATELTCEICFALLWMPITTPCQHTFCTKCLQRSLDHSSACPLCRSTLPEYAYFQDHACNKVVLALLLHAFPEEYAERGAAIAEEEHNAGLDTPIFVCQVSFPGIPTVLHLFEPRYRLMLRRCLETPTPMFGMVPPPTRAGDSQYGIMLAIRRVEMLPDGRSVVETWGVWRFRILARGTRDGYTVGRIERRPTPGASTSTSTVAPRRGSPSNAALLASCHAFLEELREGTPWVVERLRTAYVPMPDDPAQFSFWMALLLPIDEHEKAKLLPIRSPRLRLRLVVHWIEQLRSQWPASHASAPSQVVLRWLRRVVGYVFALALVFVLQCVFGDL